MNYTTQIFATLGGAVYAGTQLFVPPTLVQSTAELSLLIMLFVGGRRSVIGAVLGAVGIEYLTGISNWVSIHILLLEGVLITVVLLIEPEGIAGIVNRLWRVSTRRLGTSGLTSADPAVVPPAILPGRSDQEDAPAEAELAEIDDASPAAFGRRFAQRAEPGAGSGPLLVCTAVSKEYGGLRVLSDVSLSLGQRGIFGLCGPNGAGKSTLLNVIGGSVAPEAGSVVLDGADITAAPPAARFERGVSRTFQTVQLIRGRTVLDNVAVACLQSHGSSLVRGIVTSRLTAARTQAMEALDGLGLAEIAHREVGALTLETQRMVELARAMASRPALLLLDEPASGLSEPQRERLRGVLEAIGRLTCVLLVEHDLGLIGAVCDRVVVLESGTPVFEGDAEEFRTSELVSSLLIGV